MARRLKTIAKAINQTKTHRAEIEESHYSTDSPIPGTRLRRVGKGRWGNKLLVYDNQGNEVLNHNSAETYRNNQEVENWLHYNIPEIEIEAWNEW